MAKRGRPRQPARIKKWNGDFYLFFTDRSGGRPVTKRVLCSAHGATNAKEREELQREYRRKERDEIAEEEKFGSLGYGSSLTSALNRFKKHVKEQAELRNKSQGARIGIAEATKRGYLDTLKRFTGWLKKNGLSKISTGSLQADQLRKFFDDLASEKSRHGEREVHRGPHTLNKHRRQLRAAFLYLAELRPPLFPDIDLLRSAFKPLKTDNVQPASFTPDELSRFLAEALVDESVDHVVVRRKIKIKRKQRVQRFKQALPDRNRPVAKISRLFLVLALTGCRLGEALSMKFKDIDFETGIVTIRAQKTGMTRWLPLIDVGKKIGPQFLALLKKWKLGGTNFVVSDREAGEPTFPKGAWNRVARKSQLKKLGPQSLRQNFTSYAAVLGVPASIESLWAGHNEATASKFYRTLVKSRINADTFEESMGLAAIITKMIQGEEGAVVQAHLAAHAPPRRRKAV